MPPAFLHDTFQTSTLNTTNYKSNMRFHVQEFEEKRSITEAIRNSSFKRASAFLHDRLQTSTLNPTNEFLFFVKVLI